MTLQNDVLNPGPVLNQHPRKAWKSMTSRGGRPCCGGYPCRPPKMHQIGNEVVRDWSLWGSWYFCLFWWFLEIVSGFLWQEVRSFSWVLLSERCFVILLYIYIFNYIYISYSYVFLGTLYIPNLPNYSPNTEPRHQGCSSLRHSLVICRLLRSGLPNVVEVQPVFADMSIPWTCIYNYLHMFRCVPVS